MSKAKTPKRARRWVNIYTESFGSSTAYEKAKAARRAAADEAERVAVRMVEVRKGEVVVNVEALVQKFIDLDSADRALYADPSVYVRAALKAVGVR